MIEDFFRLSSDAVRYYPKECISSSLAVPIFSAALSALTLQQTDPLIATLHYYRDLFSFAFDKPIVSQFSSPDGTAYSNPPEVQEAVRQLIASQGQILSQRVLTGMMFVFPGDCFADASGVMMTLFEVMPQEAGGWLQSTLQMLPAGTMKPGEAERLLKGVADKVQSGETRKIRVLLQGLLPQHISFSPSSFFFSFFFSLAAVYYDHAWTNARYLIRFHQLIPAT